MMADQIKYTVHSCVEDEAMVKAMVDGAEVPAKIKCLVIEATSSDDSMGHTFRLRDGKAEDYPVGAKFTAKFVPDKPDK